MASLTQIDLSNRSTRMASKKAWIKPKKTEADKKLELPKTDVKTRAALMYDHKEKRRG